MENIQTILQELYEIDPTLREHEAALISVIEEIVRVKPNTKFNAAFAQQLKQDLIMAKKTKETVPPTFAPWFGKLIPAVVVLALVFVGVSYLRGDNPLEVVDGLVGEDTNNDNQPVPVTVAALDTFATNQEYTEYFESAQRKDGSRSVGGSGFDVVALDSAVSESAPSVALQADGFGGGDFDRVSTTNVQVLGIDEPDVIKTNGQELFASLGNDYYIARPEPVFFDEAVEIGIAPRPHFEQQTRIIDVTNPDDLELIENIDVRGDLLLVDDSLVVFSHNIIRGFDVSDPNNPDETWDMELEDSQIITSRLYDGKIYLVTSNYYYNNACPIPLMEINGDAITVPCTSIYRPDVVVDNASTYHAFVIDPSDGDIEDQISFVGSGGSNTVYMSQNNLYVTYSYQVSEFDLIVEYAKSDDTMYPERFQERILELDELPISDGAKLTEYYATIWNDFTTSIKDVDERKRFFSEFNNDKFDFIAENARRFESTGIAKIDLDSFVITETGTVPGSLLNQFSLDEHEGNLRVVTTVGDRLLWRLGAGAETANDVYVLDDDLDIIGSVKDLGLTERVYSARFMGDTAYVVTFRQIDPFYVIDLSNPRRPEVKGELKIPGFSSYLHPLKDDLILGVGEERGRVKLSLFDVSDPTDPTEVDKYSLDAYWSEVASTHHAFLQDADNEVFFIPAGSDAFIFSYEDDEIDLDRTVSGISAKRALYIDDVMFIVGDQALVSLEIEGWDELDRLRFDR